MAGNGSEEKPVNFGPVAGDEGNKGNAGGSEVASSGIEGNDNGDETVNPERAAAELRERVGAIRGEPASGPAADLGAPYGRHPDGTARKRRQYAPRGSRAERTGQEKDKVAVRGIEKLLFSIHQMGAVLIATPELELDEREAKDLASAIRDVQEHYSVSISPKTEAWANLIVVAVGLYGTRAVAVAARRAQERKEKREAEKAKKREADTAPPFVATHLTPVGGMPIG